MQLHTGLVVCSSFDYMAVQACIACTGFRTCFAFTAMFLFPVIPPCRLAKAGKPKTGRAVCRRKPTGGDPRTAPESSHERQKCAVPPCLYLPKNLQGGRNRSQSTIFPVGRVEPEAVFRHFKLNSAFLSFETLFWQPGTSKELDLEQKLSCQKLGRAPKIGF